MRRGSRAVAVVMTVGLLGAGSRWLSRGAEGDVPSTPPGAPITIEAEAFVSVGVLEGNPMEELDRVVTPFLLPNGDLAIPTQGAKTIRIFTSEGRFLRSLGGPGEGPGEFGSLAAAWARGDTIEALDTYQQRLTRFLPGDSVETVPVRSMRAVGALGPLADGWALTAIPRSAYGSRDTMSVHAVPRGEDGLATVAVTVGMARYGFSWGGGPHPLSPTAVFAVHQDQVYVAETLSPVVRVYAASGVLVRELSLPLGSTSAPGEAMRAVIDSAVARADEDQRMATRERWSGYPEPDRLSVLWDLLVDALGYVWVRPYDPLMHALALDGRPDGRGGPGGRWLVLSPSGAEVGWIEVPSGFEPAQITADAVVGVYRDEIGVESARVHRLSRW